MAMIFALLAVPLMGCIGMAVDGARWYQGRQATSQAVDAAVLTAARKMQLDPNDTAARLKQPAEPILPILRAALSLARDNVDFVLDRQQHGRHSQGEAIDDDLVPQCGRSVGVAAVLPATAARCEGNVPQRAQSGHQHRAVAGARFHRLHV